MARLRADAGSDRGDRHCRLRVEHFLDRIRILAGGHIVGPRHVRWVKGRSAGGSLGNDRAYADWRDSTVEDPTSGGPNRGVA